VDTFCQWILLSNGLGRAPIPTPLSFRRSAAPLPEEQVRQLRELAARLGLGDIADHIRLAIDRHLAHPPTLAVAMPFLE
jgi:hypothetical protein